MNTLDIAAIGLQQDLDRLRQTSQNVANLGTPGYKRQVAVQQAFEDLVNQTAEVRVHTDPRAGKLVSTGQPLDVALPEGRYLLVESDDGAQALTRQGALQFDADGFLRTAAGRKVLGGGGPIAVSSELRSKAMIDAQGQLKAEGRVLDALRLIRPAAGRPLVPLGSGLYAADSASWDADSATAEVRGGQLELSNVMPSQEMVNLMSATRHAETMVRLFQAADDMQATAIRRFGENN